MDGRDSIFDDYEGCESGIKTKPSSPREQLQERIYNWLHNRIETFHAPYGVLTGLHTPKSGRGKVRTVVFGMCRTLDACLYIWSPNRLDLGTNREEVSFKSEQEFYDYCVEKYGAKK